MQVLKCPLHRSKGERRGPQRVFVRRQLDNFFDVQAELTGDFLDGPARNISGQLRERRIESRTRHRSAKRARTQAWPERPNSPWVSRPSRGFRLGALSRRSTKI